MSMRSRGVWLLLIAVLASSGCRDRWRNNYRATNYLGARGYGACVDGNEIYGVPPERLLRQQPRELRQWYRELEFDRRQRISGRTRGRGRLPRGGGYMGDMYGGWDDPCACCEYCGDYGLMMDPGCGYPVHLGCAEPFSCAQPMDCAQPLGCAEPLGCAQPWGQPSALGWRQNPGSDSMSSVNYPSEGGPLPSACPVCGQHGPVHQIVPHQVVPHQVVPDGVTPGESHPTPVAPQPPPEPQDSSPAPTIAPVDQTFFAPPIRY